MSTERKFREESLARSRETEMPERSLWCAVLYRAIYDAAEPKPPPPDAVLLERADARRVRAEKKGKKTPKVYDGEQLKTARHLARVWLLRNTTDFDLVCDYAGLDPQATRDAVRKMRDKGWPRVVLPGDNRTYDE